MSLPMSPLPAEDFGAYLRNYPAEITFGDEPPEEVFDRYHHPGLVWVNDGIALDRQQVLDHAAVARRQVDGLDVEVVDVVAEGDRVAARYVLTARMRKGRRAVSEIHVFGRVGVDGRLTRLDQLTRIPAAGAA